MRSKSNQIFKNGTLLFSEQNAKEELALAKAELGYALAALESQLRDRRGGNLCNDVG